MQVVAEAKRQMESPKLWILCIAASFGLHLISAGWLQLFVDAPTSQTYVPFKVRVSVSEPKPVEFTPPKPKEKEKPKTPTVAPNTQPAPAQPTTTTPIQGLTKDSLSEKGSIAAPIGNTLMTGDEGRRLESVDALKGDMSAPARLIAQTLKTPPYTDEALDAALEGSFIVDVFVNLDGSVKEAELRKKIGYGMDSRVLSSVRDAKFIPRKNKFGVSEEGWTELKFTLVIP